jgi:hypothetical protein
VTSRNTEAHLDEFGKVPGQIESDSGGQSGDTQGLSQITDEAEESVEELAETGQAYEAGILQGVENAAEHPERPAHTQEDQSKSSDDGPDRDPN